MQSITVLGNRFYDLTHFGVTNVVLAVTDVTTLLTSGEPTSDDLENYLTQTNDNVIPPQPMARTKQTARKTTADGTLPATTTGSTTGTPAPPLQSPGGQNLATFPRRSARFLDSDSELEQAAQMFGIGSPARSTRSQTPGNSPARGTPRRSPRRGSPAKSPGRATPAKGSPARTPGRAVPVRKSPGRSPGRGRSPSKSPGRGTPGRGIPSNRGTTPVVGAGRSIPPMLPGDPGPTPGTSGMNKGRRPGQPGFVSRGGGGSGVIRGKDGGYNLPSFSSDDTEPRNDEDDDENEGEEKMDIEQDEEVDFPNLGAKNQPMAQNINLKPIGPVAKKNINLIRAPKRGKGGLAEIARWNRQARQNVQNETKRGWMKKVKRQRDENGRLIRKARAGMRALREIRFYQKSTCFLIPMLAFQRYVREKALDFRIQGQEVRWQARALYALQEAAEAYLVAFLSDANLLTIHAKRFTLMPKDFYLVNRIRARRAVGSEVGDGT